MIDASINYWKRSQNISISQSNIDKIKEKPAGDSPVRRSSACSDQKNFQEQLLDFALAGELVNINLSEDFEPLKLWRSTLEIDSSWD